ncbi:hypothetical protein [Hymenobacter sp. BT190]|uniref:hypothetical protein n=1 Tax=Hymenobacter sp. BT190 TaxID=2763505 RepID=UPI0016512269|nr:hypothetical protein [Hymenobacter sp. BT190]MBC6700393.1 hypothetical protein [Hymenobacter sp. BT190]
MLLLGGAAHAQQSATAISADTTRAAETSRQSDYAPGEVVTPDGKLVKAYFPISVNGFEKTISYYYSHPEVRPFPKPHFISVDKIHSMTVRGQYSETLSMNGKSLHLLAARLVQGPVELFNFAEAKSVPLPIPIPGAALVPIVGIPYTKNHWYLRRNGELVEVKRGKFEEQISAYLSAQPTLATKVRAKEDGYRYQDMVRIISEYNQQTATSSKVTN